MILSNIIPFITTINNMKMYFFVNYNINNIVPNQDVLDITVVLKY